MLLEPSATIPRFHTGPAHFLNSKDFVLGKRPAKTTIHAFVQQYLQVNVPFEAVEIAPRPGAEQSALASLMETPRENYQLILQLGDIRRTFGLAHEFRRSPVCRRARQAKP
jgi:hypothetical protein